MKIVCMWTWAHPPTPPHPKKPWYSREKALKNTQLLAVVQSVKSRVYATTEPPTPPTTKPPTKEIPKLKTTGLFSRWIDIFFQDCWCIPLLWCFSPHLPLQPTQQTDVFWGPAFGGQQWMYIKRFIISSIYRSNLQWISTFPWLMNDQWSISPYIP